MLLYLQRGRCHIVRWQQGVDLKVLSPSQVRSEEARVDVYCYVALSDLTSVVEERCHGGQACWDMCLCQFFLGCMLHLEKSLQLSRFLKLADYHLVPLYYFEWLLGRRSEVQAIITAQHSTPAMEFSHTYAWLCHCVYFDYSFILHRKGVLHTCQVKFLCLLWQVWLMECRWLDGEPEKHMVTVPLKTKKTLNVSWHHRCALLLIYVQTK